MHWLNGKETNLMWGDPFFPNFKILLVFFNRVFFSTLLVYQRKILYQMPNKGWVQNFRKCESKSNDQTLRQLDFNHGKWLLPTFQRRTI